MRTNILFIALDSEITGANLSMVTLAEALREYDMNTTMVIPRTGNLEKLLKEKNISYDIVKSYPWIKNKENGKLVNLLKACVKRIINLEADSEIQKIIKRDQIHILHINGIGYGVGAKAALRSRIGLVWHIRELLEEDFHDELYNKERSYKLVSKADKIITISDCVTNKYKNLLPNSNIVKIYNGISVEKYWAEKRTLFIGDKVRIMYAGTLSEAKGIMELIEAIHLLKMEVKEKIQVVAIGKASDEYRKILDHKIQEYNLDSIITLKGFAEDVASEWKKADIACICSRFEAFGRVTVEAMMAGCLVIGADTGGTAEIIEDKKSGLLYQKGKPKDLAEKIEYVVQNKEAVKNLALNGQVRAVEYFSEDRNSREIYKVYEKILGRKKDYSN